MQIKVIVVGFVAVGATAIGGMLLLNVQDSGPASDRGVIRLAESGEQSTPVELTESVTIRSVERRVSTPLVKGSNGQRGGWEEYIARMSEFDADGDGFLSDEERRAMRESMRKDRDAKLDLDGDGVISPEERQAGFQARLDQSQRGQELMRRFDFDGDGMLDTEEQSAMDAFKQAQRQERRDEQLAQYDRDGDGVLSQEERQVQRQEQRDSWEQAKQDAAEEFDRDGDGELNIEEQQDAMMAYLERREIDRFVARFDRNGDGQLTSTDYESFVNDYGQGNARADVNNDGVVDTLDLAAYRDMLARANNRP